MLATVFVPLAATTRAYAEIFGAFVPNDVEAVRAQIDVSPVAPADPAAREALARSAAEFIGQSIPTTATCSSIGTNTPATTARDVAMAHLEAANRTPGELEKIVSPARAQKLFAQIQAAPDIPHTFVHEGCHDRAHLAAKRIEQEGVYSEKVWLRTDGDLRIDTHHSPIGYTIAMFHAATVLYVDKGWNQTERWVIDPSLFDEAVPLDVWASKMSGLNGSATETIFSSRFIHHVGQLYRETPTTWDPKDLERAREWNRDYKKVEAEMKSMDFDAHLEELVAQARRAYGETP